MFQQILLLEIKHWLKQPVVYIYFAASLLFALFSFTFGFLPVKEKEFYNSPDILATYLAIASMLLMLISSSLMGSAIFRDIRYNTKSYYIAYPITKSGYFWGRFLGSFIFVVLICLALPLGAFAGTYLGPLTGHSGIHYGPNYWMYYLQPVFVIALPNVFFTSALFFGLVAVTRNIKVIYSGGVLLLLGYMISGFVLSHSPCQTIINLTDPFAINALKYQTATLPVTLLNTSLTKMEGGFLFNRLMWLSIGTLSLIIVYLNFNFEHFFKTAYNKKKQNGAEDSIGKAYRSVRPDFKSGYSNDTLIALVRLELKNIIRDNYFWIIVGGGVIFMGFVFWLGSQNYGTPDLPRTVMLVGIFNDTFLSVLFLIILFYTGEILNHEKLSGFSRIGDSLPPSDGVLNMAKVLTVCVLGVFLCVVPIVVAVFIQLIKGYHLFSWPVYTTEVLFVIFPKVSAMVMLSYTVHILANNKFAGHGVGILIWISLYILVFSGTIDNHLLLYSYTPIVRFSDFDGIGPMLGPVIWFDLYWMLFGGILLTVASLFFNRGNFSFARERIKLAAARITPRTFFFIVILLVAFVATGGFIYYNISYVNNYLTPGEKEERAALYERTLKRYAFLALPDVVAVRLNADLYPQQQLTRTKAWLTLVNKRTVPVTDLLMDAESLDSFYLKINGKIIPYTSPLIYPRGKFNLFRARFDTAAYRLYHMENPIQPGDSLEVEVGAETHSKGFRNDFDPEKMLFDGMAFNGGLPALGYNPGKELRQNDKRLKYGLPVIQKMVKAGAQRQALLSGDSTHLQPMDLTISTIAGQDVIAPGKIQKEWNSRGRTYFHYVKQTRNLCLPLSIISGHYAVVRERVKLAASRGVNLTLYFNAVNGNNIDKMMSAYRDGLLYFSSAFGDFMSEDMRVAETSSHSPGTTSFPGLNSISENLGWNADFRDPDKMDYCYWIAARQLAGQWWENEVASDNHAGSPVISEGLSSYAALMLTKKKYGQQHVRSFLNYELQTYLSARANALDAQKPLVAADQWYVWDNKACLALYGLQDLIGEKKMNAALHEFRDHYLLATEPSIGGNRDLYRIINKYVPDSLKYFLDDCWNKVAYYDNKVIYAKAERSGGTNDYLVSLTISTGKTYADARGKEVQVAGMNDYIDLGIFAAETRNKQGLIQSHPIYFKKYRFTPGLHYLHIRVKGLPCIAGIDPYGKLIDRLPDDNVRKL